MAQKVVFVLNTEDHEQKQITLTTTGDKDLCFKHTLTLGNVTISLEGHVITPAKLRQLANQLEKLKAELQT